MIAEEEFSDASQKPALERIASGFGRSFTFNAFSERSNNTKAIWHYHPEIELVYVNQGQGKRHIGHHISYYTDGDLVLIGSMVPHFGFTDRLTDNSKEHVIQFLPEVISKGLGFLPEFEDITRLLATSQHGLTFSGVTKERVGRITDAMRVQDSFNRLLSLVSILKVLATSDEYQMLNVSKITVQASLQDHVKIEVVFNYVMEHFKREISLQEVSTFVNMTVSSFCRYFKKQTGKTFTAFVNEVRITHACKLLSETSRQVSDICFDCGYNNFAHFNKQFKKITELNPSQYRSSFRPVIG